VAGVDVGNGTTPIFFAIAGDQLYAVATTGFSTLTPTLIGTVTSAAGVSGEVIPATILTLNQYLIFVVTAGKPWIAGTTILTSSVASPGTAYAVGDTGTFVGGAGNATYTITSVDGSGSVLTYTLDFGGHGYIDGTTVLALNGGDQPGDGVDFTISIDSTEWLLTALSIPSDDVAFNNYITSATYMDGYIIVTLAETNRFYISGLNDFTNFDPLEFATKEANPDPCVAVFAAYENLFVFGNQTLEIWYDSGNQLFPFQRVQGGGVIECGLIYPAAIAKMDGTIMWIGTDIRGQMIAWQLRGYTPVRVSNHAVEAVWNTYNGSLATASTYMENGHFFFCITFPEPGTTWVYDSTTGQWHQRAYTVSGVDHPDLMRYHAYCAGLGHVVMGYNDGTVYLQSVGFYDDDGVPIKKLRRCPHLNSEQSWVKYDYFRLHMQTGTNGAVTDPIVSLRISNDGGYTFGNYLDYNFGNLGNYSKIVQWNHCGRARDRVFEVSTSAAVPGGFVDAYIGVTAGAPGGTN
jgi:hypothetical protein